MMRITSLIIYLLLLISFLLSQIALYSLPKDHLFREEMKGFSFNLDRDENHFTSEQFLETPTQTQTRMRLRTQMKKSPVKMPNKRYFNRVTFAYHLEQVND